MAGRGIFHQVPDSRWPGWHAPSQPFLPLGLFAIWGRQTIHSIRNETGKRAPTSTRRAATSSPPGQEGEAGTGEAIARKGRVVRLAPMIKTQKPRESSKF